MVKYVLGYFLGSVIVPRPKINNFSKNANGLRCVMNDPYMNKIGLRPRTG